MLRYARSLWFTGFDTALDRVGTISSDNGSTTVTGVGTKFNSDMIGSVIRYRDTTDAPNARWGLKPWLEQRVIRTIDTADTGLTTDSAFSVTTGVPSLTRYTISDPIDLDRSLINAFYRCCQWHYDIASNSKTQQIQKTAALYKEELNIALENASVLIVPNLDRNRPYLNDWSSYFFDFSTKSF
jgi:hypothetical protein